MLSPRAASSGRSASISRRLARGSSAPRSSRSVTGPIVGLDRSYVHIDHLRMQTTRSETRSISIQAPPDVVLEFVGDPRSLPYWAPGFARDIRPAGGHWLVDTRAGERGVDVRVSRAAGTVDIVSTHDPRRGVFTRVIGNGEGSEYLFTQLFPEGTSDDEVAGQLAVVDQELRTVRDVCERVTVITG